MIVMDSRLEAKVSRGDPIITLDITSAPFAATPGRDHPRTGMEAPVLDQSAAMPVTPECHQPAA